MKDLLKFAIDGNADQCFAILDEGLKYQTPYLEELARKYTNGTLDDAQFCESIVEYING